MTTDNVRQLHPNEVIPPREERDWVTSHELLGDVAITYRQLDYWTRTGLLTPLDEPTPGSGFVRRFPLTQIDRAKAIRDLLDAGIGTATIREHVDAFTTHGHIQIGAITITRTPGDAA